MPDNRDIGSVPPTGHTQPRDANGTVDTSAPLGPGAGRMAYRSKGAR